MFRRALPVLFLTILLPGAFRASEGSPAESSPLESLLQRTGRAVELFWQQVESFACTERVTQEKLSAKEKTEYKADTTFDYLALARNLENRLTVEELRLPKKAGAQKSGKLPLLSTNGFPTLLLIFHPQYQANYRFRLEGGEAGDAGRQLVHFEQIADRPSTCALVLKDRIYPLPLRGTAWIDGGSGFVRKIRAGLTAPLKEINIHAFDIEVVYQPQSFASGPDQAWLPEVASIDVRTALQHWRNTHLFSNYKRFTVESLESRLR